MANILCVDDEPSVGLVLDDTLTQAGHRAIGARNVVEALQVLSHESIDLIISDFRMPGLTGLEFLTLLQREGYDIPLIMLTGYASIENAVDAIRAGAANYITKPIRAEQLLVAVQQALHCVTLRRENDALRREVREFRNERAIVGESPAIRRIRQTIAMVAPTRTAVLLRGETGTGKALLARTIHERSDRHDKPFVQVDCGALPPNLVESALFGHERGAFSGASRRVEGAFERANGGTLLLEEVAAIRPDVQARLLRALEDQEFHRVGGTMPVTVDVRVIATTTRDVEQGVASGMFRQDLFYSLGVVTLDVPPLRDRSEDVPMLALRVAQRAAAEAGKVVTGFSPEALRRLVAYPWPGNVQELQHAVERAVILSNEEMLQAAPFEQLPGSASHRAPGQAPAEAAGAAPTGTPAAGAAGDAHHCVVLDTLNVDHAERALIKRALEVTGGNRTRTAELLGISVRTLRNKLNGPSQKAVAVD